jgi:hypothetical protein
VQVQHLVRELAVRRCTEKDVLMSWNDTGSIATLGAVIFLPLILACVQMR